MRVLVTGASGFVGPHLLAHLRAAGDEAVGMDRTSTPRLDVTDAATTQAVFSEIAPDAVIHLAAISHVGESWTDPTTTLRVNVEGTLHVLAACAAANVSRVLVVGSAEEYGRVGEADLPITEDTPLRPVSPYGVSKVAAGFLALQRFLADGLEVMRARPFSHTGPGQSTRFVVPAFAARVVAAEREARDEIPVGNLTAVRDIHDVRDTVRAYRLILERGAPGDVYNVCAGRGVAIQAIADGLVGCARRPIRLVTDPALVRPVEAPRLVGSAARLHAVTGWEPAIPLAQTLADVLEEQRSIGADAGG